MDNIVKFDKPYKFEGKEYDSLDLSGMEKMTVQDLIDIQKNIGNELAAMSVMEMTTSFAQEMAVKATGKPVEFFKLMPRGKIKKVQAAVVKGMDNWQLSLLLRQTEDSLLPQPMPLPRLFKPITWNHSANACLPKSSGTSPLPTFVQGLLTHRCLLIRNSSSGFFPRKKPFMPCFAPSIVAVRLPP